MYSQMIRHSLVGIGVLIPAVSLFSLPALAASNASYDATQGTVKVSDVAVNQNGSLQCFDLTFSVQGLAPSIVLKLASASSVACSAAPVSTYDMASGVFKLANLEVGSVVGTCYQIGFKTRQSSPEFLLDSTDIASGSCPAKPAQAGVPFQGIFDISGDKHHNYLTILETGEAYSVDTAKFAPGAYTWYGLEYTQYSGDASTFSAPKITMYNYGDAVGGGVGAGTASANKSGATLTVKVDFGSADRYTYVGEAKTYGVGDARTIYENPIALSGLAGSYSGRLYGVGVKINGQYPALNGLAISGLALESSGDFSLPIASCVYSGKLVPHGNTGIFDLTVTPSNACSVVESYKGIVTPIAYASSTQAASLLFQMISSDGLHSLLFDVQKR